MPGPPPPPLQPEPDPVLIDYLASHDAPCDWCGYNLRGVEQARCPECGGPIDLDFVMNPPSNRIDPFNKFHSMTRQDWMGLAIWIVTIFALLILAVVLI